MKPEKTDKKKHWSTKIFLIVLIVAALASIPLLFISTDIKDALDNRPLILVSVPPYKKMVQSLVGDRFTVESVVPNGYDPHLFEPKPRDMRRLKDAVLWFGIGEAFEQKMMNALTQAHSNVVYYNLIDEIAASNHKNLLIPFDKDHDSCGHAHCSESHYDRHLWLSLELDSVQAEIIYEKLRSFYPHFKGVFEGYLEELTREHDVLINWIETNLKDFRPVTFLTPHPAFSYFANEFDLHQIAIEVAGKEPNIQDLNHLLEELKTTKVDCVILQPQHSKRAAETISHDLDIPIYTIDPYNENYMDTCNRLSLILANKKKPGNYAHGS